MMTESQYCAITETLIVALREAANAVLTATGLSTDWCYENEMDVSIPEFAAELLAWVGNASIVDADMAVAA